MIDYWLPNKRRRKEDTHHPHTRHTTGCYGTTKQPHIAAAAAAASSTADRSGIAFYRVQIGRK